MDGETSGSVAPSFGSVLALAEMMRGFACPWFFSGGWACDRVRGEGTRAHEDLEVGIYRCDQRALRDYLNRWTLERVEKVEGGGRWVGWPADVWLELPDHQARARRSSDFTEPREFELFLNERSATSWLSRRHAALKKPLDEIWMRDERGTPFLRPEIQLLYKARHMRPKDEHDFALAAPRLDNEQRRWLVEGLRLCHPGHVWLTKLA